MTGNGRWVSMTLRRPKQKGVNKKKTKNLLASPKQLKSKIKGTKGDPEAASDSDKINGSGRDDESDDEARLRGSLEIILC